MIRAVSARICSTVRPGPDVATDTTATPFLRVATDATPYKACDTLEKTNGPPSRISDTTERMPGRTTTAGQPACGDTHEPAAGDSEQHHHGAAGQRAPATARRGGSTTADGGRAREQRRRSFPQAACSSSLRRACERRGRRIRPAPRGVSRSSHYWSFVRVTRRHGISAGDTEQRSGDRDGSQCRPRFRRPRRPVWHGCSEWMSRWFKCVPGRFPRLRGQRGTRAVPGRVHTAPCSTCR